MYDRYRCPGAVWQEAGPRCLPPAPVRKRGGLSPFDLDTSDILLFLVLYFLYRETGDGYATLLAAFEGTDTAVFTDDVSLLQGAVSYYVIGVHPLITVEGAPLAGPASEKASLFLYAPAPLLNAS